MRRFKTRRVQRLELGAPIIVVSGLPRSGTSLAMQMLVAAGYDPVQDRMRQADIDNPNGYYEDERVKGLADNSDKAWLREARGRAIKIISFLLPQLPAANTYQIIFMQRHLDEILASQNKMLAHRGVPDRTSDAAMRRLYEQHLEQVYQLIQSRPTMSMIDIGYHDMVTAPAAQAQKINAFLGGHGDVARMAAVVDKNLYRNRASQ